MATKTNDYYLGNQNLPTPKATFDYGAHPEWVLDIEKCKKNILYFAENFFFIIMLDADPPRQKIRLHSYQKKILRAFRDNRFSLVLSSRQSGKALDLDTPILTTKGWTTMGYIKQGDYVYGLNGSPCKVVNTWDTLYNRNCYNVEFDNGESIIADEDHLWITQSRSERHKKIDHSVKTTKQILDTLTCGNKRKEPNHRIPTCISGIAGEYQDLPIDPYILGLWLGDGTSDHGTITVGKRDITDTLNILKDQTRYKKICVKEYSHEVYTVRLTNDNIQDGLISDLRKNNILGNKHIPNQYLLADRQQRLSLLQGLMDSDGYIDERGNANFYNTDLRLAKQVQELIQSLGFKVTFKTYIPKLNGVECQESSTLYFKPTEYVCRLPFKRDRIKLKSNIINTKLRAQWHYIKNITPVETRPVRCITVDEPNGVYLAGKQLIPTHNTTCFTIFSLWRACFYGDQRILIVANKEDTAIHILSRIKMAFENLPNYLKPGTVEWGKTSVTFGNGSSISISTTSSDTGRGQTCSVLLIDEMAFIDNGILTDFWRSVYPIISSSKTAKILVASTPNGTGNLFHDLYEGAISKTENNGWYVERVDWWDVPGRDEKWKEKTIQTIGSRESFSQEFENVFLRSGESVLDEELLSILKKQCVSPIHILEDGDYLVWKMPDPNRIYAVGVDVGEGVGAAATVMQVIDITDLKNIEQVACYTSNKITPIKFIPKLNEFLQHWGKPPVLIERNNCGAQVVDQLKESYRYENIVSYGINTFNRIGVQAHTNTKYKGVTNQRYWVVENRQMKINDINTVNELHNFQRQTNGTWCAKNGEQDDRVMSLIWALMILEQEICEKYFEIVDKDKNNKPALLKITDYSTPRAFHELTSNIKTVRDDNSDIMPVFIRPDIYGSDNSDIDELMSLGWKFGLHNHEL